MTNADVGLVDESGVARFTGDIDACRLFLSGLGLKNDRVKGWSKPGWFGSVTFYLDEWHAAAWQSNLA